MYKTLYLSFLLFNFSIICSSQTLWNNDYNQHLIPIHSTEVENQSSSDLEQISTSIGNATVIGLGEATHGTKEFATFRHRLIKHLVLHHNVRVFIIEDAFATTHMINQYITGQNEGQTEEFTKYWMPVWRIEEIKNLLNWFIAYNKGKSEEDKIQVYGCDMQNFISTAGFVKEQLNTVSLLSASIEEGLNILIQHRRSQKLNKVQKKAIQGMMDELKRLNFANIKNTKEAQHLQILIRILEQSIDLLNSRNFNHSLKRDRYLAENVQHILKVEKDKRTVIWAHNQHTANSACQSANTPMGKHLKNTLGSKYYSLGTAFCYGSYYAYNPSHKQAMPCQADTPNAVCIDLSFAEANRPNFFIDITSLHRHNIMPELLAKKVYSRRAGSVCFPENKQNTNRNYRKHVIAKSFDGLIFIRNTTPVIPFI